MSADTAPAAMPSEAILRLVESVMGRDNYALAAKVAGEIEALFAKALEEKERAETNLDAIRSDAADLRALLVEANAKRSAAEAALAGERANAVDGSIDIRLDDKGGIDEIFGNGVLCHIERMDKGHWFVNMVRPDQSSEAFWLNGKGKVEFTLHEHRPAPTTGPNVEPWTVAAAIRAGE